MTGLNIVTKLVKVEISDMRPAVMHVSSPETNWNADLLFLSPRLALVARQFVERSRNKCNLFYKVDFNC